MELAADAHSKTRNFGALPLQFDVAFAISPQGVRRNKGSGSFSMLEDSSCCLRRLLRFLLRQLIEHRQILPQIPPAPIETE